MIKDASFISSALFQSLQKDQTVRITIFSKKYPRILKERFVGSQLTFVRAYEKAVLLTDS